MLSIGMGMYREIYENIQLASLLTWRYGFEGGALAFQATNFAVLTTNTFMATFGYQFIVLLLVLLIFLFILAMTDKMIHSPTAMLLKRKKVIFPIRLITLFYNVLFLSSLAQVTSINDIVNFQPFSFSMAILAIVVVFLMLVGVGVISNWKKFQVDDSHYYVLVEQMTSKKWYAKNNILISLMTRTFIISIYIALYTSPSAAGIILIIFQTVYTIYFIILLRYTKLRYFIAKVVSNIFLVSVFMVVYIGSVADINSETWKNCSTVYIILMVVQVVFFFIMCVTELIFQR
jgi:hypothetical protein